MTDLQDELADHLVKCALALAGTEGWRNVTLRAVAERGEVTLDAVYRRFPDKMALLQGLGRMVDAAVLAGGQADMDEPPRDRLFDVLMRRFDVLAEYRDGVRSVLEDLRMDPLAALAELPGLTLSMRWMLEAAGLPAGGVLGAVRVRALAVLYLLVLRVWVNDDSPDMARTMKELDNRLRQAEQLANTFDRSAPKRRPPESEAPPEGPGARMSDPDFGPAGPGSGL
ncbi:MAG: TetR family transcriptional regulator [Alphaproteobacteria bacterium]|nr:TetR family transcriptional regulator [Alphaproteobacteria bacterium]